MWFVYIIRSLKKKWYYIGSTNRLKERILKEHNQGKVRSTKHYKPFKLVFIKEFNSEPEARSYERMLKHCRIVKERIIRTIENETSGIACLPACAGRRRQV